jgi:diaminohydroxyphosphoribosylaminopyrimidine deaminase / 5-amino-6-(5-phosphoribosylamino)uracil reductase
MSADDLYMSRCIGLARMGGGNTLPNPMVGAVLVHDGKIIGEGFHRQYGGPHAEPDCIDSVPPSLRHLIARSVLYVSLEPCAHFGKTPPCADLIIRHKIPEVVVGCRDIFAKVNGLGIKKLIGAGVKVTVGVLEKECRELNKRFFTFHGAGRPWVLLKWAQTSNRKIGHHLDNRLHITGSRTDFIVHKWRSEEGAVMVGTRTAWYDNPKLTNRHWNGPQPLRVVIDRNLILPRDLHLFDRQNATVVLNELKDETGDYLSFVRYDSVNAEKDILQKLYELDISAVMIEGGAMLTQSFVDAGLWDEARIITNESMVLEEGVGAPVLKDHRLFSEEKHGNERISYYRRISENTD